MEESEQMRYAIVGWKDKHDMSEGTREEADHWQVAAAKVAYMLKDGHDTVMVEDLTVLRTDY